MDAIQCWDGDGVLPVDRFLFEFEHEQFGMLNEHHDGISFNFYYSKCSPHRGGLPLRSSKPIMRRLIKFCLTRTPLTLLLRGRYRTDTFFNMYFVEIGDYHYGQYGGTSRCLGFKRGS